MALADELVWSGHRQCETCGRMTLGPFLERDDVAPARPFKAWHIDESGHGYTNEERRAAGLPINVSHGKCKSCMEQWTREARMGSEGRKQVREREERDEFGKTIERVRQTYQETLDRGEQTYNNTVAESERRHRENTGNEPPADEAESTGK